MCILKLYALNMLKHEIREKYIKIKLYNLSVSDIRYNTITYIVVQVLWLVQYFGYSSHIFLD